MLARSLRQQCVRLSVTRRYCASQSESRIMKCTQSDSPMILVAGKVRVVEKFARGHPKGTCQMNVVIFDQYVVISRKRCILDTMVIGNHMQAIEWCHFR